MYSITLKESRKHVTASSHIINQLNASGSNYKIESLQLREIFAIIEQEMIIAAFLRILWKKMHFTSQYNAHLS